MRETCMSRDALPSFHSISTITCSVRRALPGPYASPIAAFGPWFNTVISFECDSKLTYVGTQLKRRPPANHGLSWHTLPQPDYLRSATKFWNAHLCLKRRDRVQDSMSYDRRRAPSQPRDTAPHQVRHRNTTLQGTICAGYHIPVQATRRDAGHVALKAATDPPSRSQRPLIK